MVLFPTNHSAYRHAGILAAANGECPAAQTSLQADAGCKKDLATVPCCFASTLLRVEAAAFEPRKSYSVQNARTGAPRPMKIGTAPPWRCLCRAAAETIRPDNLRPTTSYATPHGRLSSRLHWWAGHRSIAALSTVAGSDEASAGSLVSESHRPGVMPG
jgi:hypothetical protein